MTNYYSISNNASIYNLKKQYNALVNHLGYDGVTNFIKNSRFTDLINNKPILWNIDNDITFSSSTNQFTFSAANLEISQVLSLLPNRVYTLYINYTSNKSFKIGFKDINNIENQIFDENGNVDYTNYTVITDTSNNVFTLRFKTASNINKDTCIFIIKSIENLTILNINEIYIKEGYFYHNVYDLPSVLHSIKLDNNKLKFFYDSNTGYEILLNNSESLNNIKTYFDNFYISSDGSSGSNTEIVFSKNVTLGDSNTDIITVNGTTTFNENALFQKDITVNGTTTFNENVLFQKDITVKGNINIGDNISDLHFIKLDNNKLKFFYDSNTGYEILLNNSESLNNIKTYFDNFYISSDGSSGSNTEIVFSKNVTLGDSNTDIITVNGTTTFNENVLFQKDITVKGNINIGDNISDVLTINSTSLFNSNINIADNKKINFSYPQVYFNEFTLQTNTTFSLDKNTLGTGYNFNKSIINCQVYDENTNSDTYQKWVVNQTVIDVYYDDNTLYLKNNNSTDALIRLIIFFM